MEKEFNYQAKALALNIFSEEEPSPELELLLRQELEVLDRRLNELLGKSFKSVEFNLNVVDDQSIRVLNRDHRNKDSPTDVLSFPLQDNVRRGEFDEFAGHLELGDVFIAAGVCAKQAKENGLDFNQEFAHLLAHGFLHLCGYDHEESEAEDRLMRGLEERIMDELAELRKKNGP